jgi:hypothetical protein
MATLDAFSERMKGRASVMIRELSFSRERVLKIKVGGDVKSGDPRVALLSETPGKKEAPEERETSRMLPAVMSPLSLKSTSSLVTMLKAMRSVEMEEDAKLRGEGVTLIVCSIK